MLHLSLVKKRPARDIVVAWVVPESLIARAREVAETPRETLNNAGVADGLAAEAQFPTKARRS
jgi:hypothetical protein